MTKTEITETGKRADSPHILYRELCGLKGKFVAFAVVDPEAPEDRGKDVHFVGQHGGVFERLLDPEAEAEPTVQLRKIIEPVELLLRRSPLEPIPLSTIRPGTVRTVNALGELARAV